MNLFEEAVMTVKTQVKELFGTSKAKVTGGVKTLEHYWGKTITPFKEKSLKDLLDQFGGLKTTEVVEKIKSTDIGKHWNVVKHEVLTTMGVAEATEIEKLHTELQKLSSQVEALKKLKTDLSALKREVTKVKKAK